MARGCPAEWDLEAERAPGLERLADWPGPLTHRKGQHSSCHCVMTIPHRGFQRLSAAHAVLDVHEAQALPAFPLLCHLGLNSPRIRSGSLALTPPMGTGEGPVPAPHPLPSGPSCCSVLAASQGPPRVH